jgi:hypothetical protein
MTLSGYLGLSRLLRISCRGYGSSALGSTPERFGRVHHFRDASESRNKRIVARSMGAGRRIRAGIVRKMTDPGMQRRLHGDRSRSGLKSSRKLGHDGCRRRNRHDSIRRFTMRKGTKMLEAVDVAKTAVDWQNMGPDSIRKRMAGSGLIPRSGAAEIIWLACGKQP